MNNQIISQKIKELREFKNMIQKEFGDLINVAQTTLSSYENGSKSPNIETLYNIAETCNVSIDWLCGRTKFKNIEKLDSYSDVFRTIVNLCKAVEFVIKIDSSIYYDDFNADQQYLIPENGIVNDFINRWRKIKDIYDDKTIDEDTYNSVMESIIHRYDSEKLKYNDIDDF